MQQESKIDLVDLFYQENKHQSIATFYERRQVENDLGLEPYTGNFGKEQRKHLLIRSLCGLSRKHLKDIENLNLSQTLDLLFSAEKLPAYPVNDYYLDITKEETEAQGHYYIEPGKEYYLAPEPNGSPWPRHTSMYGWWYKNIILQKTSIHYKFFYFLHNLLACSRASAKMEFQHYVMLFNHCFGNYKKLLYELTLDPMMLDYLNLQFSNVSKPDENYARELQELFTVGKGPGSQYTEDDVVAMSKVLVGFRYTYESKNSFGPIQTVFQSWNHDTTDKQFSSFYGNKVIKGRVGDAGKEELNELLDMIFDTPECGLYLCRRLYQFFCYPIISESAEKKVIEPMAELFRKSNYQLMVPLKALLGSAHFFHADFYNAMIKSPMEFVMGVVKTFSYNYVNYQEKTDIPSQFTSGNTKDYYFYKNFNWNLGELGLNFFDPPNVAGWPAFYQSPVFDLFWINSVTMSKRANFANSTVRWGMWIGNGASKGNVHAIADMGAFIRSFSKSEDVEVVLNESIELFMGGSISASIRERLRQTLLENRAASYYTDAVKTYLANPTENNLNPLENRFRNFLATMLQMGEAQLF